MSDERVPDLLVEQLLLEELPEEQAARVSSALAREGGDRLEELRSSNREILEEIPPERFARAVERKLDRARTDPSSRRGPAWPWLLVPAAATAAALWMLWPGSAQLPGVDAPAVAEVSPGDTGGDTTRIKGLQPSLRIYRQVEDADSERLSNGARVSAGDTIQIAYVAAGSSHGTILSVDGSGSVTVHLPSGEASAAELNRSQETPLPHAFELDDAPRFERFFFVTAPPDAAADLTSRVRTAVEALAGSGDASRGDLELPKGYLQTSFLLSKP